MIPPKKKGMSLVIAMGKPKQDPETPDPIEEAASPMRRRPAPPSDDEGAEAHEAAETPAYEASEETGAKLIEHIDAIGEQHGMDSTGARAFASDLFGALSECLRGGEGGEPEEEYPA